MKSRIGDTVEIEGVAHSICAIYADRIAVRELASGTTKEIQASDFAQLATVRLPSTSEGGSLEIDVAAPHFTCRTNSESKPNSSLDTSENS